MGINRTKLATKLPAVMVAVVATSALHAVLQLPGVAMIAPLPAIFPSVNMPDFPSLSESAHIAAASVLFVSPLLTSSQIFKPSHPCDSLLTSFCSPSPNPKVWRGLAGELAFVWRC